MCEHSFTLASVTGLPRSEGPLSAPARAESSVSARINPGFSGVMHLFKLLVRQLSQSQTSINMQIAKLRVPELVMNNEPEILADWIADQTRTVPRTAMLMKDDALRDQCREFLQLFTSGLQQEEGTNPAALHWAPLREFLAGVSRSRSEQGFSPAETATFVMSLKRPLFAQLRKEIRSAEALGDEIWIVTQLLDNLALHTTDVFLKTREEIITRQQHEMMELSTPVVKLWDGVLALPIIGTLDSARTQIVMESLLQKIVETGSNVAIIDITGVPTVDTLVAQHLLKTVTAARLMGADCIISGIRPQIAQTIVHLGVTLNNVTTKANLADAFLLALQRSGSSVSKGTAKP
jgi:rsbT co-antagonist protein RsbR